MTTAQDKLLLNSLEPDGATAEAHLCNQTGPITTVVGPMKMEVQPPVKMVLDETVMEIK